MLTFTHRLTQEAAENAHFTLPLTAEERTRSRHYFQTESGQGVYLRLPRGTVLRHGDLLQSEDQKYLMQVIAKPEPVLVVTAETPLDLLRAAYHLGNRHVPLEITTTYLRLTPDFVLQTMLEQLGLQVTEAVLPFEPEAGAYGHSHGTGHSDEIEHSHEMSQMHTHHSEHDAQHHTGHSHS